MIDPKKWEIADDSLKMMTLKVIQFIVLPNAITKADTQLLTAYMVQKLEEK